MFKKSLILLVTGFLSVFAYADESTSLNQAPKKKELVFKSPPISLIDYSTMKKELILNPDEMTPDEALRFIPPLPESEMILDIYLEEGFSVMDAIQYTHQDILDLYKGKIDKTESEE